MPKTASPAKQRARSRLPWHSHSAAKKLPDTASLSELRTILVAARPQWQESGATDDVVMKLVRADITCGEDLVRALESADGQDLNAKLVAKGLQVFNESTLDGLCKQAKKWKREMMRTKPRGQAQATRSAVLAGERPPAGERAPAVCYEVVAELVLVRERPDPEAPVVAEKVRHDEASAREETFDGWVRLEGEPGWILRDLRGRQGVGRTLQPSDGEPLALAVAELADDAGLQKFEVVSDEGCVRAHPDKASAILERKYKGDLVDAESQSYNGWVRVSMGGLADGGWMLAGEQGDLRCRFLEERAERRARRQNARGWLRTAAESFDPARLEAALEIAREAGVELDKMRPAEARLWKMQQKAREESRLRNDINGAQRDEKELRACLDACIMQGFRELAVQAQEFLDQIDEERAPLRISQCKLEAQPQKLHTPPSQKVAQPAPQAVPSQRCKEQMEDVRIPA